MANDTLEFRWIQCPWDEDWAFANYRDACIESFGSDRNCSEADYLAGLRQRREEFPDGHVMAYIGHRLVGQLEIQVPYGLKTGYINLFYIAPLWRRCGYGRRLHQYAQNYLHSWEANAVELHVSPTNGPAVQFYRAMGYQRVTTVEGDSRLWKMRRELSVQAK